MASVAGLVFMSYNWCFTRHISIWPLQTVKISVFDHKQRLWVYQFIDKCHRCWWVRSQFSCTKFQIVLIASSCSIAFIRFETTLPPFQLFASSNHFFLKSFQLDVVFHLLVFFREFLTFNLLCKILKRKQLCLSIFLFRWNSGTPTVPYIMNLSTVLTSWGFLQRTFSFAILVSYWYLVSIAKFNTVAEFCFTSQFLSINVFTLFSSPKSPQIQTFNLF